MILYKPWPDGWNYGGVEIMNNYFEEHYDEKFVIIQFPWPCYDQDEYDSCNFKDNSNHSSWVSAKEALLEVEFDYLVIYEPVEWMFYEDAIEDYYNFFESCNIPMEKIIYQGANHNMYGYYDYIKYNKLTIPDNLIKTLDSLVDKVVLLIKSIHNYKIPEIIKKPISIENKDYEEWMLLNIKK